MGNKSKGPQGTAWVLRCDVGNAHLKRWRDWRGLQARRIPDVTKGEGRYLVSGATVRREPPKAPEVNKGRKVAKWRSGQVRWVNPKREG